MVCSILQKLLNDRPNAIHVRHVPNPASMEHDVLFYLSRIYISRTIKIVQVLVNILNAIFKV